jgi:hypothetical protein
MPEARRRWFVLRASFLLPLTAMLLRFRGLRWCLRLARWRLGRVHPRAQHEYALASEIHGLVNRANQRYSLLKVDCLPLSIVTWYLTRHAGCATTLRLGVRTLMGRFESHAWVELRGMPIGEIEDVEHVYATIDIDHLLN